MLLEVLSDFQISIPELGVVEARTHPLVLLTSNNSRELTEALKRRCLYLWLDYPDVERELEIVRLHAPELDEEVARKLVEVDPHGPRARPQEAAVDRRVDRLGARAAPARRRRHRPGGAQEDDVDHRQAPHRPRPRGRARGREAGRWPPRSPAPGRANPGLYGGMPGGRGRRAWRRGCSSSPTSCAREGMAVGTSELLDAFAALEAVSWTSQEDFREALAATLAKSQEDRRVLDLVFDRFFFRAVEREAVDAGLARGALPGRRGARPRGAARAHPRGHPGRLRRRDARPGPARDRRLRAPGRGLGRDRRRRAAHPAHARPEGRAEPGRRAARPGRGAARPPAASSSATCAASSSGQLIERTAVAAAGAARCASSTARCPRTPRRTSRRCTAWWRS